MTPDEVIAHALLHYVDPPGRTLWGSERSDHKAQFVLSALKAAGLVIVPAEPTFTMMDAGIEYMMREYDKNKSWDEAKDVIENLDVAPIYRAMIRAATSPDATDRREG